MIGPIAQRTVLLLGAAIGGSTFGCAIFSTVIVGSTIFLGVADVVRRSWTVSGYVTVANVASTTAVLRLLVPFTLGWHVLSIEQDGGTEYQERECRKRDKTLHECPSGKNWYGST